MKFNPYARQTMGIPVYVCTDRNVYLGYIRAITENTFTVETTHTIRSPGMEEIENNEVLTVDRNCVFSSAKEAFEYNCEFELE